MNLDRKTLDNANKLGKDLETLFKEGEDENEEKIDYGNNSTY